MRLMGPLLSVLFHIALIALLVKFLVFTQAPPKEEKIEVTYVDDEEIIDLIDAALDDIPEPEFTESAPQENLISENPPEEDMSLPMPSPLDNQMPALSLDTVSPLKLNLGQADLEQLSNRRQTAFGAQSGAGGDLIGTLYDFKRTPSGNARDLNFPRDIRFILEKKLSPKAFQNYFAVPKPIYFNYLLIGKTPASEGPRAFGAADYVEPSQFIVHYTGEVQAPASGEYRFAGEFDDLLLVLIDGEVVLEAGWGQKVSEWQPTDFVNQHKCYTEHALVYGSWVNFNAATPRHIDIIIGEEPGGYIGGLLLIQRRNASYQTVDNGRPLLPLFTVQPLTAADRERLASFPGWRFDPAPPPVMGRRRDAGKSNAADDDVHILVH